MNRLATNYSIENYSILDDDDLIIMEADIVKVGMSAHGTYFSKESILDAQSSLPNKPILCVWNKFENDFKEHARNDYDLDELRAIGNIPESNNATILEKDGEIWQKATLVIWKKYINNDMIGKIKNKEKIDISMEIDILEYSEREDGYYNIDKYRYEGICLLGDKFKPAIKNAKVVLSKYSLDISEIKELNNKYYNLSTKISISEILNDIKDINNKVKNPALKYFYSNIVSNEDISIKDIEKLSKLTKSNKVIDWCNDKIKLYANETITIDNSKESAINSGTWSNPGSKLYERLLKSQNSKSLLNEAYLIIGNNYKESPSSNLKYPHHTLSGDKLVINIAGIKAASSRLNQMKSQNKISPDEYQKAMSHINKHRNELELDKLDKPNGKESTMIEASKMAKILKEENACNKYVSCDEKYVYYSNDSGKFKATYSVDGDKISVNYAEQEKIEEEPKEEEKPENKPEEKNSVENEKKIADLENEKKMADLENENKELKEKMAKLEEENKKYAIEKNKVTVNEWLNKYSDFVNSEEKNNLLSELEKYSNFTDYENMFNKFMLTKISSNAKFSKKDDLGMIVVPVINNNIKKESKTFIDF